MLRDTASKVTEIARRRLGHDKWATELAAAVDLPIEKGEDIRGKIAEVKQAEAKEAKAQEPESVAEPEKAAPKEFEGANLAVLSGTSGANDHRPDLSTLYTLCLTALSRNPVVCAPLTNLTLPVCLPACISTAWLCAQQYPALGDESERAVTLLPRREDSGSGRPARPRLGPAQRRARRSPTAWWRRATICSGSARTSRRCWRSIRICD